MQEKPHFQNFFIIQKIIIVKKKLRNNSVAFYCLFFSSNQVFVPCSEKLHIPLFAGVNQIVKSFNI